MDGKGRGGSFERAMMRDGEKQGRGVEWKRFITTIAHVGLAHNLTPFLDENIKKREKEKMSGEEMEKEKGMEKSCTGIAF